MSHSAPFKIRSVQKKDKVPLSLMFLSCFSHEPFLEKWTLRAAQKRVAQILADPQVVGWVATVFGYPVGFAFLQIRQELNEVYGELLETAVHPYFQKSGYGVRRSFTSRFDSIKSVQKIKNVMVLAFRGKHEKLFKKAGWSLSKRTVVFISR